MLFAAGCAKQYGADFDLSKADQFKPGVTTYDEAVSQLGKPTAIRKYADGKTGAAWQTVRGTLGGGSAKGVGFIFDASGVMERMTSRTELNNSR